MLVSSVLTVYLMCFFGNPIRFDKLSMDEEQFQKIINSRRSASEVGLLKALLFDEQQLTFDVSSHTFYYSLEEGSKSAYNPYVEINATHEKVSVAVLDAQITAQDIGESKAFRMIAYDDQFYCEYNLVCTTLPLMNIECDMEIGQTDMSMYMTLFDNRKGAACKFMESEGNIHVRGASTRAYPKKGYKLSLTKETLADNERPNKVSLLGMRQDDDWILYAAYNDQEKIRNVFSANLWKYTCARDNALGIDNGMEYKYIELFINHQYWGLYALGYPIDELQLETDMSKNERLYKKVDWSNENQISLQPEVEVAGYRTTGSVDDEWETLKRYYSVLHSEWKNSQKMYEGIDIDNAIDIYLFVNLIQGMDQVGGMNSLSVKNMFLSFHNKGGKETVLYTPWDMDITWGQQWNSNVEENLITPYGTPSSQNTVMGLGNLPALILNGDDEVWNLIIAKYWKLREYLWSEEYLNHMIDDFEEDIYLSGAFRRDRMRWPNGTYWDTDKGMSDFRNYVIERLHEMDDYYSCLEKMVLGENAVQNVYIIRSAQYKNFLNSKFILELNDKTLLRKKEYREFLEYIGVDIGCIGDNVNFVVINGIDKKTEYFETFSALESIDTCIGTIRIEAGGKKTDVSRIYVDDIMWCTMDMRKQNRIELEFGDDESASRFDFSKEYVMWSGLGELEDPQGWCDMLKDENDDIIIEIINHDTIKEGRFQALLEGIGVDLECVSENTDFIVVRNDEKAVTVLDDSHNSGTRCDTVLGELSLFYNDEGVYGIYMNNEECILASFEENEQADVRVAVLSHDPYKVLWCFAYAY